MTRLAPALALAAAMALFALPAKLSAAEPWRVLEARAPDPVQLRISGPLGWDANESASGSSVLKTFFATGSLQRGLLVSGEAHGPVTEPVGDLFLLSRGELEALAHTVVNEYAKNLNLITQEIKSFKIEKVDGINGLKVVFETIQQAENTGIMSIHEIIYIPYNQNVQNVHSSATILLQCTLNSMPDDWRRVRRTYNAENRRICQRFYKSLAILDRWR
jgi:hypothetical protein